MRGRSANKRAQSGECIYLLSVDGVCLRLGARVMLVSVVKPAVGVMVGLVLVVGGD